MTSLGSWSFLHDAGHYGFAHRGGDEVAPENTLEAFQRAIDLGFRYLETDVHLTSDGVLVAFHDAGLERLTGLPGIIADHTWDALSRIDLGNGHRIPRFDDLLAAFPNARFNIEPKSDIAVAPLAGTIAARGLVHQVCIGSFKDDRVERCQRLLGPELCTSPGPMALARLTAMALAPSSRVTTAQRFGAVQIPPKIGRLSLNERLVERYHRLGLQVHVWTVNDPLEMHRLYDLGVDALMSDRVSTLKQVLVERGSW